MPVVKLMGFVVAKVQLERENSKRELRENSLREGERKEREWIKVMVFGPLGTNISFKDQIGGF